MDVKPCEMPCSKCGSAEVSILYRAGGSTWRIEEYGRPRNRYAFATSFTAQASREHIDHTCGTCRHNWQTLPMRKPRKSKPDSATGGGGEG